MKQGVYYFLGHKIDVCRIEGITQPWRVHIDNNPYNEYWARNGESAVFQALNSLIDKYGKEPLPSFGTIRNAFGKKNIGRFDQVIQERFGTYIPKQETLCF